MKEVFLSLALLLNTVPVKAQESRDDDTETSEVLERFPETMDEWSEALQEWGDQLTFLGLSIVALVYIHDGVLKIYRQFQKNEEDLTDLEKALGENYYGDGPSKAQRAQAHLEKGVQYLVVGEKKKAASSFAKAIKLGDGRGHLLSGILLLAQGKKAKAQRQFTMAGEENLHSWEEIETRWREYRFSPQDELLGFTLSLMEQEEGRLPRVKSFLDHLCRGGRASACLVAGDLYREEKNRVYASLYYKRAFEEAVRVPDVVTRAHYYSLKEEVGKAGLLVLGRALERYASLQEELGDAAQEEFLKTENSIMATTRDGHWDKARRHYQRAHDLGNGEAAQGLAGLRRKQRVFFARLFSALRFRCL